jgi:signal transduction histidine kinase
MAMAGPDRTTKPLNQETVTLRAQLAELEAQLGEVAESARQQRALAEALQKTTPVLISNLDLNEKLDCILSHIRGIVPFDAANVMVVDSNTSHVVRYQGYEQEDRQLALRAKLAERPDLQRIAETENPVIITDAQTYAGWSTLPDMRWIHSHIGVPLRQAEEVIGFLNLDSETPAAFTSAHAAWLETFADQISAALITSQLRHAEAQHQQEAETLREITTLLRSTLDLDQVIELILDLLQTRVPYDKVAVLLSDGDYMQIVAAHGYPRPELVLGRRVHADENQLLQEIRESRHPLFLRDAQVDSRFQNWDDTLYVHGWLGVPLLARGDCIGLMAIGSYHAGVYGEEEAQLAQSFADQAAIAISNAQLYEEVRRYAIELEQRVNESTTELREANEEVRRFAYIVSHDLRAPLVNIKGFAAELHASVETLQEAFGQVSAHLSEEQQRTVSLALQEEVPEALAFIDSSVSRMDRLIKAILQLARLGQRELKLEPIDMNDLVHELLQSEAYEVTKRLIKVTVGSLPNVVADRMAMELIVGNILSNAVLYLDPDRPGKIEILGQQGERENTFHIRDTGRGISEQDRDKVFDLFRRASHQDVPGEGMGLVYVQTLVRRHGGRIWFESEVGAGTTFSFTISNQLP